MRVVAIFGEPGSGKSTLMKKIMENLEISKEIHNDVKLVPYHKKDNIYILGKYEDGEVFGGTDKMSMACQPEVVKFLDGLSENSTVIFEGDRLSTVSFLENCNDKFNLYMIYLKTDREVRNDRYKERGSNQNETWLSGRETKISNILGNMELKFVTNIFENNNIEDQQNVIKFIESLV